MCYLARRKKWGIHEGNSVYRYTRNKMFEICHRHDRCNRRKVPRIGTAFSFDTITICSTTTNDDDDDDSNTDTHDRPSSLFPVHCAILSSTCIPTDELFRQVSSSFHIFFNAFAILFLFASILPNILFTLCVFFCCWEITASFAIFAKSFRYFVENIKIEYETLESLKILYTTFPFSHGHSFMFFPSRRSYVQIIHFIVDLNFCFRSVYKHFHVIQSLVCVCGWPWPIAFSMLRSTIRDTQL